MVPADRVVVISYRLSIVTMSPSAAVWPQFSVEGLSLRNVLFRNILFLQQ